MTDICRNCKYCYPFKTFKNNQWEYSHCCILFPLTEKDGFVLEITENDVCEMFTGKDRE